MRGHQLGRASSLSSIGGASLAMFLMASSATAQTLSWDDCIREATKNNPALRSAQESLQSTQEQTQANKSGFYPQITGSVNYDYTNTKTLSGGGANSIVGGSSSGSSTSAYTASLTANQNIFNGLADKAKVEEARANEGISQWQLQTIKAQVSYNLKTSYGGLSYAQRSVTLAQDIINRRASNLRLVELRFKDGRENKGSVLLYQAYLKDAHYGELQSRNQIVTAKAQLAQAIGLDDYQSLEITGDIPLEPAVQQPDLEKLAVLTPAYLKSVYQTQHDEAAVTAAKSGFFPTLGLTASAQKSGNWFPENDQYSLAVNLTFPLFNGGRDYYGTRAAIETRKASELTQNDTAHSAVSSLQQAFMSYTEAVQKVEVDQSYLEAAKMRADIARANYTNGITSFQDWDTAENDLITRQKGVLQSEQNRIVTEAAWDQAKGQGVIP